MRSIVTNRLARVLAVAAVGASVLTAGATTATAAGFGPHLKSSQTRFGHPHHGGAFSGGNWGGYASTSGGFTTATASWTEPDATCTSSNDLFAPWVGIDGDGSSTVEQTGVATDCSSGSPVYQAWYEMYPAAPVYYNDPVSAGDSFTGTIEFLGGGSYKLTLTDNTKGWTETTTQSLNAQNATAEAIIESPTDSYPTISGVTFTGVKFNGTQLADTNPQALNADDRGTGTFVPGPINGDSFTIAEQ